MNNAKIIYNAIKTPDGTIIESRHRHDFNGHLDANGKKYYVDGGLDYLRRLYDTPDYQELSLYDTEPHIVQRAILKWGTYGKGGKQPLKLVAIQDMTNEHLQACLDTCPTMHEVFRNAMNKELEERSLGKYPNKFETE